MEAAALGDPNMKYQKLASEYSKIRAQLGVLKKAVLDEQANVLELKGLLKDRDHVIRKNEQETESLTFRNQQLTRRVAILQEELDERAQKQRGKNKHKSTGDSPTSPPQFTNQILLEELQQKIHDNERLHQQLYDSEAEHVQTVGELQKRLEDLERKAESHDRDVNDLSHSNQALIERLQQDRARLEVNLQTALKELKETNFKAEVCQEQFNSCKQNLGFELRRTTEIIKSRLPFIDTNNPRLNRLNVPACSRRSQEQSRQLVEQAGDLVTEVAAGLSNFHTYCQQRAPLKLAEDTSSADVGRIQLQLIRHLHENASYVRQMEQSFRDLRQNMRDDDAVGCFEMTVGFDGFVEKLGCYVTYLKKLMPYQMLSLEEENNSEACPAALAAKNRDLLESWHQLIAAFSKVWTYSRLLTVGLSGRVRCKVLKSVSVGIGDIHTVLKDISVHYNGKLTIEKSLPTVADRLKTTDECVVTSLVSLVANLGKLSDLLVDKLDAIFVNQGLVCNSAETDGLSGTANRFSPRVVAAYKRRAADYISCINEERQAPSVPYAEALRNRHIIQSSTESRESLALQVSNCQEKIAVLEQSREHWMLEYQLLHMKQEKMQSRLQDSSPSEAKSGEFKDDSFNTSTSSFTVTSIPSLVGNLDVTSAAEGGSELSMEGSEDLRRYFVDRINNIIVQRQMADSKAVTFHAELCNLRKRLLITESSKRALQDQLRNTEDTVASLKEELHTTTNNYKAQLSTMSEHLANMNEKLTTQKDEIDELKFSLSNVGNRKTKGK